jgi:hypothetical protein
MAGVAAQAGSRLHVGRERCSLLAPLGGSPPLPQPRAERRRLIVQSMVEAMADIKDGSTVLIGGFGAVGQPNALIDGLIEQGATGASSVTIWRSASANAPRRFRSAASAARTRLHRAPQSPLGGDPNWIGSRSEPMPSKAVSGLGRDGQCREAEPAEVRQPGGAIGEARLGFSRQTSNQRGGERMLAHVAVSRVIGAHIFAPITTFPANSLIYNERDLDNPRIREDGRSLRQLARSAQRSRRQTFCALSPATEAQVIVVLKRPYFASKLPPSVKAEAFAP